ncbi:MAG: hypothetical protein M1514_00835 [Patescibacteria group bacterium]|nr:hypothetical protein [Patescibacteria group bacterium]
MRSHRWTESQLKNAVKKSTSIRQIIHFLGLKEAGGNYKQIKKYLHLYNIDCSTLKGQCWNKGLKGIGKPILKLEEILKKDSYFQSHKLKKIVFSQIKK